MEDVRDTIREYLNNMGISKTRIAEVCGVSRVTLSRTMSKKLPLPKERLALINEFLRTDFKLTEPQETFPHEQRQIDEEKSKNIFKDESNF